MNNKVIVDTRGMFFKYKVYKFEGYKLRYERDGNFYVYEGGRLINSFNKHYISEKTDKITEALLKLHKYFKKNAVEESLTTINNFKSYLDKKYGYLKKVNCGTDNKYNVLLGMAEAVCYKDDNSIDYKKEFNENKILLSYEIYAFIKEYGIPDALVIDNEDQHYKISISDFIEKLIDLFKFRDYVYNGEFYIDTTEISTAKYGLTRGEYGEPVLIAYFIDPFEYIKFKIILSKLTDVRKIVSCEYCGSLFISQKSNRRFCDNLCRAQGSRKRKKELENKKRKKE